MCDDFVDQSVFFGFFRGHVEVAVGVFFDHGKGLAGMVGEHFV